MLFHRIHSDGLIAPVPLENHYAGPTRTACWIIGGGPSLRSLPLEQIASSPVPRFAVNLTPPSLRPDFWTAYDPTARFDKSIYLDASITKFLHRRRANDLVPETTYKVCDCPNTVFFQRDQKRGFHNFLFPVASEPTPDIPLPVGAPDAAPGITDWQDSLIQAIEIAYQLGFRTLYLAGCEMHIPPSSAQRDFAKAVGVTYQPRELLSDFVKRLNHAAGNEAVQQLAPPEQYHFNERKPLASALSTDHHYFRVAQYLRLSRRSLALAGLDLISITPGSRLNDYFPYRDVESILNQIRATIGDPQAENRQGRYTQTVSRTASGLGPMRDFPPHNWRKAAALEAEPTSRRQSILEEAARLAEVEVPVNEIG